MRAKLLFDDTKKDYVWTIVDTAFPSVIEVETKHDVIYIPNYPRDDNNVELADKELFKDSLYIMKFPLCLFFWMNVLNIYNPISKKYEIWDDRNLEHVCIGIHTNILNYVLEKSTSVKKNE